MDIDSEPNRVAPEPAVVFFHPPLWRTLFALLLAAAFLFSAYTSYATFSLRLAELVLASSWPWAAAPVLCRQNQVCLSLVARTVVWVLLTSSVFVCEVGLSSMKIGIGSGLNVSIGSYLLLGGVAGLSLAGAAGGRMIASFGFYALLAAAISCQFALVVSRLPRVSPALLVNIAYMAALSTWDPSVQRALAWRNANSESRSPAGVLRVLIQTGLLVIILAAIAAFFIYLDNFVPIDNSL